MLAAELIAEARASPQTRPRPLTVWILAPAMTDGFQFYALDR